MAERQIKELPGNSIKDREAEKAKEVKAKPSEKKEDVKPIVTSGVKVRKKSIFSKIRDTATGEDAQTVGEYVVMDVLIPAAKRAISDAVSQGIEKLLFGEVRRPASSNTSYRVYSSAASNRAPSPWAPGQRREMSYQARASHDFGEIVIEDRFDAEHTIDMLGNYIDQYEVVTVGDLYDLVGHTSTYADRKWGWTDIRGASTRRVPGGFMLVLPKPQPLK